MPAAEQVTITCDCDCLSYREACEIAARAAATRSREPVRIQLGRVVETTTAALARLIALRQELLRTGRDLRITGLRGRAEHLYQISNMASLLPRDADTAA